jgi:hypothetical protein
VVVVRVPEALAGLLRGTPGIGAHERAFPFITVDERGYPHVALLSRSELDVPPDGAEVLAAIGSPRTRANLERDGRAGLVAIAGTVAHYVKLRVTRRLEADGLLGCALEVVEHKGDSLGIPLESIGFRTTAELSRSERWDLSARMLRRLADRSGG